MNSKSQMSIVLLRIKASLEQNFLTAKEPTTHGSSAQLVSQLNENWSSTRGKFGSKDPLELFFSPVTSICWAVSHSNFPRDVLMKTFFLYLKMLPSITSSKYSKRTRDRPCALCHWINFGKNSCKLPISKKIYQNIYYSSWSAQPASGGYFCSWTGKTSFNIHEHKQCTSRNKPNNPFYYQNFGLEQITLRRNGLPIASVPISTEDHKRLYFNTLSALGLLQCGLGITLDNYRQHFIMCFASRTY